MSSLPSIILTPEEDRLAQLLVNCAQWVEANPAEVDALRTVDERGELVGKPRGVEKVELRIAGGWVRDKLLGQQSHDIDVSISPEPLTGLKFATLFEKYLHVSGLQTDDNKLMGTLTKIEAKPEQSKHLETATAKVMGLDVDWVQLRGAEVYTEDSRIPTASFGTPLEDAERRDLTINALFYNLQTRQIEDQTGKGLADLGLLPGGKRIRTPLPPFQTFRDDPLRVIRAVRFAARFGREFVLDEELIQAVKRPEIVAALMDPKKISRERVGIEFDKMLLGQDPLLAYEIIEDLDLYPTIFLYDPEYAIAMADPPDLNAFMAPPDPSLALQAADILAHLQSSPSLLHPHLLASIGPTHISALTQKRLYLACGLLPLYDGLHKERAAPPATKRKKGAPPPPDIWKTAWLGEKVVLEGIKGSAADKAWESSAHAAHRLLSNAVRRLGDPGRPVQESDRVTLGLLLRNPAVDDMRDKDSQTSWTASLLWSLVVDLARSDVTDTQNFALTIMRYNTFVDRILSFKLDKLAFSPRLLDGKAVQKLLPTLAKGPAMVYILDQVVQFQLANPGAGRGDCEVYLTSQPVVQAIEAEVEALKLKKSTVKT